MDLETKKLSVEWLWRKFSALSSMELYQLLKLRQDIFVLEQNCLYADIDNQDFYHQHLLAYSGTELIGYLRIIPSKHHSSGCVAIGRVAISRKYRGLGLAREMMEKAMDYCAHNHPSETIFVSAQLYLQSFYQNLGFKTIGDGYLEDDIPHIAMKKVAKGGQE